jgi:hypothetical protein
MVQSKFSLTVLLKLYHCLLTMPTDLGILPGPLHHHLSPRVCNMLPNHSGQEPQRCPSCRRHPNPIQPQGCARSRQGSTQVEPACGCFLQIAAVFCVVWSGYRIYNGWIPLWCAFLRHRGRFVTRILSWQLFKIDATCLRKAQMVVYRCCVI